MFTPELVCGNWSILSIQRSFTIVSSISMKIFAKVCSPRRAKAASGHQTTRRYRDGATAEFDTKLTSAGPSNSFQLKVHLQRLFSIRLERPAVEGDTDAK